MKKIVLFQFLLTLCFLHRVVFADCVGPDYASVQAAVTAANYGDTVSVCGGSATWDSKLTVSKGLKLIGAGIDSTIITLNSSAAKISFEPDNMTLEYNHPIRIEGFTVDAGDLSVAGIIWVQNLSTTYALTKVVITKNKLIGSIDSSVWIKGAVYGVAYENEIVNSAIAFRHMGLHADSWENFQFGYGGANNFYVEDNKIYYTVAIDAGYYGWVEGGQGGRYVYRYNTWDYTTGTTGYVGVWDAHGNQPLSSIRGTMGFEVYGNSVRGARGRWMDQRGGRGLMFKNFWYDNTGSVHMYVREEYSDSLCPIDCPEGWNCTQHVNNSYYWANHLNTGSWTFYVTNNAGVEYEISKNVDVWEYNSSFDGQSGTGCGTLANLPATCTTGVGYWATNQSCSDLTGLVGAAPGTRSASSKIEGTLYLCGDNNWIDATTYTPYTYPHPLRGESTPALTIPQGVHIGGGIEIK